MSVFPRTYLVRQKSVTKLFMKHGVHVFVNFRFPENLFRHEENLKGGRAGLLLYNSSLLPSY